MSDEKLEAMFQLLHEENKSIEVTLLSMCCYPQDFEKTRDKLEKDWDKLMRKVVAMK